MRLANTNSGFNTIMKRFVKGIVLTGLGAKILEKTGGSVANSGLQGLQQFSNFYPTMGTLVGAKQSLNSLKKLRK